MGLGWAASRHVDEQGLPFPSSAREVAKSKPELVKGQGGGWVREVGLVS